MLRAQETACARCRDKKVRCTRTLPRCQRCTRADAQCDYPQPPDRKLVAARRRPWGARKAPAAEHDLEASLDQGDNPGSAPQIDPTTPGSLRTTLIEIFFSSFFQATLTFHQPTFDSALLQGQVPRHTLLAIAAVATNYVDASSLQTSRRVYMSLPIDVKALGKKWALDSGSEVHKAVDRPGLPTVQTCQLLAFYWFSMGDRLRDAMFGGMAFRLVRALLSTMEDVRSPSIEAEQIRRCFWAAFLAHVLNSDNYILGSFDDPFSKSVPLPVHEQSYWQCKAEVGESLATLGNECQLKSNTEGVMAEIVKASVLWARVRDFLAKSSGLTVHGKLDQVLMIDLKITEGMMQLPPKLQYTKATLETHLAVGQEPIFCLIHALYHQTRLVLHASVFPLFSGTDIEEECSYAELAPSAQAVLHSANSLSGMAAELLRLGLKPCRLAPFIGYATFASATVHLPFICANDRVHAATARRNLASSLRLLEAMLPYWENLRRLWARIHLLYEAQSAASSAMPAAPDLGFDSFDFTSVAWMIQKPRHTGLLTDGPFAESVLTYCLPALSGKLDIDPDSQAARDLGLLVRQGDPTDDSLDDRMDTTYLRHATNEIANTVQSLVGNVHAPCYASNSAPCPADVMITSRAEAQDLSLSTFDDLEAWLYPAIYPVGLYDNLGVHDNVQLDDAWADHFITGNLAPPG